jgi:class 3 adenylate cyclase/pimeloyl-ACP methyl ester carboxylesterase
MLDLGPTRYATTSDGLSIAYKQWGEGERVIVLVPGTYWHCELTFEMPVFRRVGERLGALGRVLCFDKRGCGLSDRHLGAGSLDDRIRDISAVMDDAGVEHATILGLSEGGAMGALTAATLPDRVDSLVLMSGLMYGPFCADHPRPELGRSFGEKLLEHLQAHWGTGEALSMWMDGGGTPPDLEWRRRTEQYMFTPRGFAELMRRNMEIDVRPVLPLVAAPTLVVHAVGDHVIPPIHGRIAAGGVPGAELVELDVPYHGAWFAKAFDPYLDVIEEWLTGRPVEPPPRLERVLATVLFTDIVDSTATASRLGDHEWRSLLDDHDRITARCVARYGGNRVKSTGDGVLATFDGPARALDCACAIRQELKLVGMHMRAGVHAGEIELREGDVAGIGVHLAARVLGKAGDGEIWVSSTIPGLVVGSGHEFEPRGSHELKGIPGEWPLAVLAERVRI